MTVGLRGFSYRTRLLYGPMRVSQASLLMAGARRRDPLCWTHGRWPAVYARPPRSHWPNACKPIFGLVGSPQVPGGENGPLRTMAIKRNITH